MPGPRLDARNGAITDNVNARAGPCPFALGTPLPLLAASHTDLPTAQVSAQLRAPQVLEDPAVPQQWRRRGTPTACQHIRTPNNVPPPIRRPFAHRR